MSVRPSVRPSTWNNSAPTGRIFMKFDILTIFRKSVEKIQVSLKSDKKTGLLYVKTNIYIFIISRSFLLRMKNISDKDCRENQKTLYVR